MTSTTNHCAASAALLTHLATLPRNDLRYGDTGPLVPTLTIPTDTQRRAFEPTNIENTNPQLTPGSQLSKIT